MRIVVSVLFLFFVSCVYPAVNRHELDLYRIKPEVERCVGVKFNWKVYVLPPVDSRRILYSKNGVFRYYAYSRWLCEPSCMFEDVLYQLLGPPASSKFLLIKVLDFEVVVNGNRMSALLRVRAFLTGKSKEFAYLVPSKGSSLKGAVSAMQTAVSQFAVDLCRWLEGEDGEVQGPAG